MSDAKTETTNLSNLPPEEMTAHGGKVNSQTTISTPDVRAIEKALRYLREKRDHADQTIHMLLNFLSERRQVP